MLVHVASLPPSLTSPLINDDAPFAVVYILEYARASSLKVSSRLCVCCIDCPPSASLSPPLPSLITQRRRVNKGYVSHLGFSSSTTYG